MQVSYTSGRSHKRTTAWSRYNKRAAITSDNASSAAPWCVTRSASSARPRVWVVGCGSGCGCLHVGVRDLRTSAMEIMISHTWHSREHGNKKTRSYLSTDHCPTPGGPFQAAVASQAPAPVAVACGQQKGGQRPREKCTVLSVVQLVTLDDYTNITFDKSVM